MRIEDDVVVTANGAQSLTNVPRTVADIEAVMAGAPWPPQPAADQPQIAHLTLEEQQEREQQQVPSHSEESESKAKTASGESGVISGMVAKMQDTMHSLGLRSD